MRKGDIKPFVWGVVVGAVALLIVIFATGWVVTSGSAEAKAENMAEDAVLDRLAPICVAQFQQDPDRELKLSEIKKLTSYGMNNRSDYVKNQGWATMPGEMEPDSEVADECAERIVEIEK